MGGTCLKMSLITFTRPTVFVHIFLLCFILHTSSSSSHDLDTCSSSNSNEAGGCGDQQDASVPELSSSKYELKTDEAKAPRYLLYDVNPGEGFNLRRDVYMRVAVLVHNLNKHEPWVLVLPPWGRLYHWKSRDIGPQLKFPWSAFFDLPSLRLFTPVMEFDEFLKISKNPDIDQLIYLQNYPGGWDKWEEKLDVQPCTQNPYYYDEEMKRWYGWFFGYEDDVSAKKLDCLSFMGHASFIIDFLRKNITARAVMLDRAEVLLHDHYGDVTFWKSRRSMRFAKHLRDLADAFRQEHLDSSDEKDQTVLDQEWTSMKKKYGDAKGGPYLGVHLRRDDFVQVRSNDIPSLKYAAEQIKSLCEKFKLKKVFIATDAPKSEFKSLREQLEGLEVFRYEPTKEIRKKHNDGGVAIIDQWICAHARHFIGTKESTFSFRIQDEREILGFQPDTTFRRFCTDKDKNCEQPAQWKIVY